MSERDEIRERTNRAPLAQLRDVDEKAWNVLMTLGSTGDPDHTTTVQAIAADLLGAHDLARLIRDTGFYPLSAAVISEWPDWTKDPITLVCEHPLEEFSLVEDGYQRQWYTQIDEDEKTIKASYGGSGDYSDEGNGREYLQCGICLSERPIPDDYDIDWN